MKHIFLLVIFLVVGLPNLPGRTDARPVRQGGQPSATLTAPTHPPTGSAPPTVAAPQPDHSASVAASATPVILCQVCVLVDGEWQWLDECARLRAYGTPCTPAAPLTETPAAYP